MLQPCGDAELAKFNGCRLATTVKRDSQTGTEDSVRNPGLLIRKPVSDTLFGQNIPWIRRILFQLTAQDGNRQSHLCQTAARIIAPDLG